MCWMSRSVFAGYLLIIVFSATLKAQLIAPDCYPQLVDRRDLVEGERIIQRTDVPRTTTRTVDAYLWEVEIDERAHWEGVVIPGAVELHNDTIPGGHSIITQNVKVRGPGVVTIRESVIFRVEALSAYKYDPIFQTICLFNLEPLHISAKLLPCEE